MRRRDDERGSLHPADRIAHRRRRGSARRRILVHVNRAQEVVLLDLNLDVVPLFRDREGVRVLHDHRHALRLAVEGWIVLGSVECGHGPAGRVRQRIGA